MRTLVEKHSSPFADISNESANHKAWLTHAFSAAVFCLIWLLFAWPWLSGHVTIPWDAKAHFAPQVQFMAASFGRGELPFWNPYAFAGHPQIADPQSMLFSPPMLLLALVNHSPSLWAIDTVVVAMLLFAGLSVIWLAYDLGWHWAGGLVAAIGFAFGAAMAWRLQHFGQVFSLAYFPLALLLLRRSLDDNSMIYGALAGVVAACIVLGRDQVALLCVYLLIGYVVWYWFRNGWNLRGMIASLRPLMAGGLVGAAIVALPILMTAELAAQSNRPSIEYAGAAAGSLHPALLVTAAIPHLFGSAGEMANFWGPPSFTWENTGLFIAQNMGVVYIGSIPLLLIFIGAIRGFLWAVEIRYITISFVLILLYALGWYTPFFRAVYEVLPGVDLYRRPADGVFVFAALAALLAGYTAHRLMQELSGRITLWQWILIGLMPLGLFGLAFLFAIQFDQVSAALQPLAVAAACMTIASATIMAAVWLKPIRPILAGLLLTVPTGIDVAFNNGPNGATALPASALAMLETNKPNETVRILRQRVAAQTDSVRRPRVELAGLGFHWPNASLSHGLENTLGYNPVRLRRYTQAVAAGDTVGLPDQRKYSALFPSYRSQLANMLGLRYIATGIPIEQMDKTLAPGDMPLIARTRSAYIYENTETLPRVIFATATRRANFDNILKTGVWPGFDPRTTVLLDTDAAISLRRPAGTAQLVSYRNTEIVVETKSTGGGWLVLNDLWHPWWIADVNGMPTPIYQANVLFRAVEVGPGQQTVRFTFRPVAGAISTLLKHRSTDRSDK